MRALVVIPTYQEADNIDEVLRRLRVEAPDCDVLVVDDASPDGTAGVAEAAAARLGGISVLRRPSKSGLGSAYRDGFRWGFDRGYEVLVEMDGDLSHDPASLPSLLAAVDAGADVAIGSRYIPGGSLPPWSIHRRALSRWGNRYAGAALGLGATDATSGFRAYRAEALATIGIDRVRADGYGFQIEGLYRMVRSGCAVAEVPIRFSERGRGSSKMTLRIIAEAFVLVTSWALRDRFRRLTRRSGGNRAAIPPLLPPE